MKMLGYLTVMLGLALVLISMLYFFVSMGTAMLGSAAGAVIMALGVMMAVRRR